MSKIWLKSYTPEIESLVETYYYKAFRRKVTRCVDSIILLPKTDFWAKCREAGFQSPVHDIFAFLDNNNNWSSLSYRIYCKFGWFDNIVEDIGHELFHRYLYQQEEEGKLNPRRREIYVINEAFAHLGSWYFHDQLYNDETLREKYSVQEFNTSLPKAKEHRRAYNLTNKLVEKFYPRYFTPVKRLLLEATMDEIAEVSGLPKRKFRKK